MNTNAIRFLIAIICVMVLLIVFYPEKEHLETFPKANEQVSVVSPLNGGWTNASKTKYIGIRVFKSRDSNTTFANLTFDPNMLGIDYKLTKPFFWYKLENLKSITYANIKLVKINQIVFHVKNNSEKFYRVTGIFKFASTPVPVPVSVTVSAKPVINVSPGSVSYPTIVPPKPIAIYPAGVQVADPVAVIPLPYNGNYNTPPRQLPINTIVVNPYYGVKNSNNLFTRTDCANKCVAEVRETIPGAIDTMTKGNELINKEFCNVECAAQYGRFIDHATGKLSPQIYATAPRVQPVTAPDGSIAFYPIVANYSKTPKSLNTNSSNGIPTVSYPIATSVNSSNFYPNNSTISVINNSIKTNTYPTTTPYKQPEGNVPVLNIPETEAINFSISNRWVYFDNKWVYFDSLETPLFYNTNTAPINLMQNAIPIDPKNIQKFSIFNKWVFINDKWVYYNYYSQPSSYDRRPRP